MIYILVCARTRDSAWGMEREGGGGNWSQRAAFRMNGGGAAAPTEPMLDPGRGCQLVEGSSVIVSKCDYSYILLLVPSAMQS